MINKFVLLLIYKFIILVDYGGGVVGNSSTTSHTLQYSRIAYKNYRRKFDYKKSTHLNLGSFIR